MRKIDWKSLAAEHVDKQRALIFSILQEAASEIQLSEDDEDSELLEIVPRLAGILENQPALHDLWEPFSALARAVGLWNYIPLATADDRERLLAESMSQDEDLDHVTLHRKQAAALKTLLDGKNLILSAPTSFGKSLLIDAAIASGRFERIAIVVPTIALLDETRRRLARRFGSKFDILMHHSEASTEERVIFLGTQERLINRKDIGKLDLLVVDEFYKLDPSRKDDRSPTLNAAVYKLIKRSKQFFFLGPNIENVLTEEHPHWKFEFLSTKFATVAVDTFDMTSRGSKFPALQAELYRAPNWPALVFASSPDRANELASWLSNRERWIGKGGDMADWLSVNFGSGWGICRAVRKGIAVHHGRVPRAVASHFVRMFNQEALPIMICTSTLIEGVNTAAKSVFIYDKAIENRPYDFFTFSNIRGRAGRLGEHHVGNVYLFASPPPQDAVDVAAPLFNDYDDAPSDFAIHVEDEDLSARAQDKMEAVMASLGLEREELRRFSSVGVIDLAKLKVAISEELKISSRLVWSGWPDWGNLLSCCRVICAVKNPRKFGTASAKQLAWYLHRLRINKSMHAFHAEYSEGFQGDFKNFDQIFKFLRACEYSLPEYFAAIEMFLKKMGRQPNYGIAVHGLPRWWRADALKNLEERGIPIQIGERFYEPGDDVRRLNRRLVSAAQRDDERLTPFERDWVLQAQ
jgi:hypothetical protein